MPMSNGLMDKAKDCIDYISSKKKEKVEVSDGFATNLIELSEGAVQKLAGEKVEDGYNLWFIKPSKKFYNNLMSVWMSIDTNRLGDLDFSSYLEKVKERYGDRSWKESFTQPVENFYQIASEEFLAMKERNNGEDSHITNCTTFFTNVKAKLLDSWNESIVCWMQKEGSTSV